jgi:iron complex outermembrane receptor protein
MIAMRTKMMSSAATAAVLALMLPMAAGAQTAPSPAPLSATSTVAAPADSGAPTEEVIVTGTRQQGRTKQEAPAPVDVISGAELQQTGEQNVFDALNKVLPSFDLPPFGFDTAGLVRSARLRGLSPDDVLVLVDGKRRHVSANINADIGPVGGSDPVDLDMIPLSLIDHIEVLRDGAAAQYGSDAIAGVINIILKHSDHGGAAFAQEGATYVGDGFTNNLGANQGFALGNDGFFDIAADYRYHDHTSRSGNYPSAESAATSQLPGYGIAPVNVPTNVSHIEGDPRYNLANIGYNAEYNTGLATLYSFATYGYRHSEAFENYRDPNSRSSYVPDPGTPYPNATAFLYYPDGFEPLEADNEDDYSGTVGARGDILGDYHWDLSTTYGGDVDNLSTLDTINPDFLHEYGFSPTHVHAGEYNDSEWTTNLDINKPFDIPFFAKPLSIAVGGEFRRDTYQLNEGDYASRYGGGAQAYPGFTPQDQGYYSRTNEGVYADFATNPLPNWQIDAAARFEHYSDVGDTETGKFTTRYDFSPQFGIRGTISNGFRAPTLAQEGFAAVNVSPTSAGGQFPVDSPAARYLGSVPLKPERSQNYSAGFVSEPISGLHVDLDFYKIDIRDQIVDSGLISGAGAVEAFQLAGSLPPGCSATSGCFLYAQFFTNGVNTHNEGADLTADYTEHLPFGGKINWLLAANFNSTTITREEASAQFTPDVLSEIKEATPKSKVVLQATYINDPWLVVLRETRFGQVAEILADGNSGGAPFTFNRNSPKFITDLEITYKITKDISFTLGADNVFDTYPNHTTAAARYNNAEEYIASAPYGIDGGVYYGRLNIKWGGPAAEITPPALPPVAPPPAPVVVPVRTYLVFFDWDRADLTERAKQIVAAAAQASTHVQTTTIEVNGYTDLSGTVPYNQKLSVRRAETVKTELVKDGVPASEIDIHGYGESHPLVPTAKGVREPQNRRVEIILK